MTDRVFLTGATGFIGGVLHDPLRSTGWAVRCLTRNLAAAQRRWPNRDWVAGDAANEEAMVQAMEGCRVAYYLVHGMGGLGRGWVDREVRTTEIFARASHRAGVQRIIYLGGVAPQGRLSEHLRARLLTGEALRSGSTPCLELRAAMIVGVGSASWTIVRDLAARLPAMVLPAWLVHRSEPVSIEDVVGALLRAIQVPLPESDWRDLPGPALLSGVEILREVAVVMGRRPLLLSVPMVTPHLSSHWIRLVTRVDHHLAAELVAGLMSDLISERPFWSMAKLPAPLPLAEAASRALRAEANHLSIASRAMEALAGLLTPRA